MERHAWFRCGQKSKMADEEAGHFYMYVCAMMTSQHFHFSGSFQVCGPDPVIQLPVPTAYNSHIIKAT